MSTLSLRSELNGWTISTDELPEPINGEYYETLVCPTGTWDSKKCYRAITSEGARGYHNVACLWARAHAVPADRLVDRDCARLDGRCDCQRGECQRYEKEDAA